MVRSYTDTRPDRLQTLSPLPVPQSIPRFTSRGIAHASQDAFPPYLQLNMTFIDGIYSQWNRQTRVPGQRQRRSHRDLRDLKGAEVYLRYKEGTYWLPHTSLEESLLGAKNMFSYPSHCVANSFKALSKGTS